MGLNRRGFLKFLGVAPALPFATDGIQVIPPKRPWVEPVDPKTGEPLHQYHSWRLMEKRKTGKYRMVCTECGAITLRDHLIAKDDL